METLEQNKIKIYKTAVVLFIILSAYFAVKIFSELKKDSLLGENVTPATITLSGHGEIMASPDIANVYFTITKDDKTVAAAQASVAVVEKNALAVLKAKGVDDKDITTANASFNPKYEYRQGVCPTAVPLEGAMSAGGTVASPTYCGSGKQVLIGYTASESITVKIRKTDTVGDIMQSLGTTGVSDLNGPDFAIDNPDALQAQARAKAISDAKTKAEALAKDLGVSLGKIESFSDGTTGNYPSPVMYGTDAMKTAAVASAPAVIPKGQNTISSDVTITYEIR